MEKPEISVVIPHYNDLDALDRCLHSLERQTIARDRFAIVVADNNSPLPTAEIAGVVAGRALLVVEQRRGAGPARNAGVAATSTRLLCFIDSDCVAEPGWIEAGLAGLDRFDFCGGPVNVLIDHDRPLSPSEAFELVFAFDNERYVRDKAFTGSGNLFTSRDVFDAVGGFGVGMSEDLDWSHRAQALGYTLGFVSGAAIGHPARRNWQELKTKWLRIQSETRALAPSGLRNNVAWLARSWAMPLSIVAHTPRILRSPKLKNAQDRRAAFKGLVQQRIWRFVDGHRLMFGWRR